MNSQKTIREPLFHVSKRTEISLLRQIIARVIAIFSGIIVCCVIFFAVYGNEGNPLAVLKALWNGNFGTERNRWTLLRDTALLLGVGCALIPAFKMKFWNLGGNGQVLIGALVTIACMRNYGGTMPDAVVWLIMLVSAVLCGALWAAIPAVFKAFFKTNESLFTLMMNYIAMGLVVVVIKSWTGGKKTAIDAVKYARLPQIGGNEFLLIIIVAALVCASMFVYMKYTKHGFEASVVGESENTARYVGINVKKTVIANIALSGALCGLIGFLIAGGMDFNVSDRDTARNLGFTAIIAVWVAKMNPLGVIFSSFGIVLLSQGMIEVQTVVKADGDAVKNMSVGIVYFFVIGCEFFIYYILKLKRNKRQATEGSASVGKEV